MIASRVCPLIDWFQVVYDDCTVYDVLVSIGLNYLLTDDVEKVLAERIYMADNYINNVCFNFNGVLIKMRGFDLQKVAYEHNADVDDLSVDVFDWVMPYIQLTLSGSALAFLRESGVDIDKILFEPLTLSNDSGSYHVTRVDFAFDLVNYRPDFLDKCIDQISRSTLPSGRLMSVGQGGMCYTLRNGSKEKTLYLGSTKSNKLLRIYDKNMQYQFKQGSNPYMENGELPESWIRVELQCRRQQECHKLLYGCEGDMMKVLRYIYENFALVESDGSAYGKERHVSECWITLFDWEGIGKIIQNANCAQVVDQLRRAENFVENIAFGNLCVFVAFYGWGALRSLVNSKFHDLQLSSDILDQRRFNTISGKILSVNGDFPLYIEKNQHGLYELKE